MASMVVATKSMVASAAEYFGPSADVLASGVIEVNLANIAEGESRTFLWRGKPVFVRHRTPAEISKEEAQATTELRDPQTDQVSFNGRYDIRIY